METEELKIVSAYGDIENGLKIVREQLKEVPDAATKEGYKAIVEVMKVKRKLKKELVAAHKTTKAEALAFCRVVDGEKNRIMASLDDSFEGHLNAKQTQDDIQAKIDAEEAEAAAQRVRDIQNRMEGLKQVFYEAVGQTSEIVGNRLEGLRAITIDDGDYGDFAMDAMSIKAALIGKLETLYESTKTQEEMEAKIMAQELELEKQRETQRIKDEIEEQERRLREDQEQEKRDAEAAKLKAENDAMRAELEAQKAEQEEAQRIIDEKNAAIKAEQEHIEEEKRNAAEAAQRFEDQRIANALAAQRKKEAAAALKKQQEEWAIEEAEEKKQREEAEALAQKEAVDRRCKLAANLQNWRQGPQQAEDLIKLIEEERISYIRIDWTQK